MRGFSGQQIFHYSVGIFLGLSVCVYGTILASGINSGFYVEAGTILLLSLPLLLIPILRLPRNVTRKSILLFAGIAVILSSVLSALFVESPLLSLVGFAGEWGTALSYIFLMGIVLLGFSLGREEGLEKIIICLAVGLGVATVVGTIVYFFSDNTSPSFGFFIGLTSILLGGLSIKTNTYSYKVRVLLYGSLGVCILLLALLGSVIALWGVSAGGVMLLTRHFLLAKEGVVPIPWGLLILVVVVVLLALSGSAGIHLNSLEIDVKPSLLGTMKTSFFSWEESTKDLLLGSGPNTFQEVWSAYRPAEINNSPFWNTSFALGYSSLSTAIFTTGLVGLFAWLLFLVASFVGIARMLFSEAIVGEGYRPAIFATIAAVGLIWGLLTTVSFTVLTLSFFFLGLAFGASASGSALTSLRRLRIYPDGLFIIVALVVVFSGMIFGLKGVRAALLYGDGSQELATNSLDSAIGTFQKAISLKSHPIIYRALSEAQQRRLDEIVEIENPTDDERLLFADTADAAVASARMATELGPDDFRNWITLGNIYTRLSFVGLEDTYSEGVKSFGKAVALAPTNPIPQYLRARLQFANGKYPEAAGDIRTALIAKPDYEPALELKAQLAQKGVPITAGEVETNDIVESNGESESSN